MLHSLTLKNFRCFQNFTIEPLERINLIGGKNKVGKTSLLEAIFIFINPTKLLGEAAQAGYFNWDSPAFDGLKLFLQAL